MFYDFYQIEPWKNIHETKRNSEEIEEVLPFHSSWMVCWPRNVDIIYYEVVHWIKFAVFIGPYCCNCWLISGLFSRSASNLLIKPIMFMFLMERRAEPRLLCWRRGWICFTLTDFGPPPSPVSSSWTKPPGDPHYTFNTTFHKLNMQAVEYVC